METIKGDKPGIPEEAFAEEEKKEEGEIIKNEKPGEAEAPPEVVLAAPTPVFEPIISQPPLTCPECKTSIEITKIDTAEREYKINFTCQNRHKYTKTPIVELINGVNPGGHEVFECSEHPGEKYIAYCTKCNQDLCIECSSQDAHKSHLNDVISYVKLLPSRGELLDFVYKQNQYLEEINRVQKIALDWVNELKKKLESIFENQRSLINLQKSYGDSFSTRKLNISRINTMNYLIKYSGIEWKNTIKDSSFFTQFEPQIINYLDFDTKYQEKNIYKVVRSKIPLQSLKSNIIKTQDHLNTLLGFFERLPKDLKKLYSAKASKGTVSSFHDKCDDKLNTLIIVKTTQGCVFGGYTEKNWRAKGALIPDDNAFLFSLDHKMVYRAIEGDGIYPSITWGPEFYGKNANGFVIKNKCLDNKDSLVYFNNFYNDYNKARLITTSNDTETHFQVSEYEVFHVIYPKHH